MDTGIRNKINEFFEGFPLRRVAQGQIMIQAHEDPQWIYHLTEGRVKQFDISYRGDEVVLNAFKPPAFFPMSFAINRTPNLYFYQAETAVKYHQVPFKDALDFLRAHPDILFNLLARVYSGTDGLLGRLAHLMAGSARSRILYELLIECRRFGEKRAKGTAISLTESDIAAHAGLARETVSRELRRLKVTGLVIVKHDIVVTDLERLSTMVSHEL